jgi:hypothetical protein
MLLADAAQVADRKLFILGGGISLLPARPAPTALAMIIQCPWDQANLRHDWTLEPADPQGSRRVCRSTCPSPSTSERCR